MIFQLFLGTRKTSEASLSPVWHQERVHLSRSAIAGVTRWSPLRQFAIYPEVSPSQRTRSGFTDAAVMGSSPRLRDGVSLKQSGFPAKLSGKNNVTRPTRQFRFPAKFDGKLDVTWFYVTVPRDKLRFPAKFSQNIDVTCTNPVSPLNLGKAFMPRDLMSGDLQTKFQLPSRFSEKN